MLVCKISHASSNLAEVSLVEFPGGCNQPRYLSLALMVLNRAD